MIRTVAIPTGVSRLARARTRIGQLEISQGCVQYQDPNTGLWVSDPNTPACGLGAGDGSLPDDPGNAAALQQWAAGTIAASNLTALNAGNRNNLVLAESLMPGNVPSPLPGLGLTIPDPMKKWLEIAVIGLIAYMMLAPSAREARRGRS